MDKRFVVIELSGEVSLDGATRPGGDYHIREYDDDGDWVGGGYANRDNLEEKITEFLTE